MHPVKQRLKDAGFIPLSEPRRDGQQYTIFADITNPRTGKPFVGSTLMSRCERVGLALRVQGWDAATESHYLVVELAQNGREGP